MSRHLGAGDALEYWKSGSYLLNFMESYKLKRELRTAIQDGARRAELAGLLDGADGLLDVAQIEAYARIDPGNARLRSLMTETVDNDAWRLLWLPPALPYYQLGPALRRSGAEAVHQAPGVLDAGPSCRRSSRACSATRSSGG